MQAGSPTPAARVTATATLTAAATAAAAAVAASPAAAGRVWRRCRARPASARRPCRADWLDCDCNCSIVAQSSHEKVQAPSRAASPNFTEKWHSECLKKANFLEAKAKYPPQKRKSELGVAVRYLVCEFQAPAHGRGKSLENRLTASACNLFSMESSA